MSILYPIKSEIQSTIDSCSPGDMIYLPNEEIDFQIIVNKDCLLYGQGSGLNRTSIKPSDLSSLTNKSALIVENCSASISNIDIFNKNEQDHFGIYIKNSNSNISECSISAFSGIKIENCISSTIEDCSISDSKTGIEISNSYGLTFSNNEIYKNETGVLFSGSSNILGDIESDQILTSQVVVGKKYKIKDNGLSDFTSIGASSNNIGTEFVATSSGSGNGKCIEIISISNIIPGKKYIIKNNDITDFTTVGASSNVIGTTFIATGTTSGSGTVIQEVPATKLIAGKEYRIKQVGTSDFTKAGASSNTIGTIFIATKITAGTGLTDCTEIISAADLIIGNKYKINYLSTTDFTSIGASSNNIGTEFIATSSGSGNGTVLVVPEEKILISDLVSGNKYIINSNEPTDFTLIGASSNNIGTEFIATSTNSGNGIVSGIITAELRTDRVHHISFELCNIFSCQNGIMILNSDNLLFENCKIYNCSSIGITQHVNSYSNKFRGEIFNIGLYGIKNNDPQEGLHVFDAMETWWGDSTGPSGLGKGRGVKISKNVDYSAWARSGTEPDLTYPGTRRWIWNMLGYPQVKVELTEEDVTDCINMAIDKYLYYLTPDLDYYYVDVGPNSHEYKLPPWLPKSSITEVIYQPSSDIFAQLSGSGESFFLTYYMQGSGGTFLSDFYAAIAYKETMERTLGIAPSYEFLSRIVNGQVEEYIRIYPKPSIGMKLGIKYNRMISEVETDSAMWIRKYALTWAKEKLGRVRSKYASVPGPTGEMQLDGSTLLSEAATEREALLLEIISLGEPLAFSTG